MNSYQPEEARLPADVLDLRVAEARNLYADANRVSWPRETLGPDRTVDFCPLPAATYGAAEGIFLAIELSADPHTDTLAVPDILVFDALNLT